MGVTMSVNIVSSGQRIGTLEKEGNHWIWTNYDENGAYACGWTWEPGEAMEKSELASRRKES